MNNEITLLLEKLKKVSFEINNMIIVVDDILQEAEAMEPASVSDFITKEGLYRKLNAVENALRVLDNKRCDILSRLAKGTLPYSPIDVNYNSHKSIESAIAKMDDIIPALNEYDNYMEDDFSKISPDFIADYRKLLNVNHDIWVEIYRQRTESCINSLNELMEEEYGAVLKKDEGAIEYRVERVEPIPFSEAPLGIREKFSGLLSAGKPKTDNHELEEKEDLEKQEENNNGISVKDPEDLDKSPIRRFGERLVAVGKEKVERLKNYFANKINNKDTNNKDTTNTVTDFNISGYGMKAVDFSKAADENTPLAEEKIAEAEMSKPLAEEKDAEPKMPESLMATPIVTVSGPAAQTIDDTIDAYVKVENEINNNSYFTDEQKKQWRNTLWDDFDKFVEQNPETNEETELNLEQNEVKTNLLPGALEPKSLPNGQVYHEKLIDTIDRLNEEELERYIKELGLTMEEIEKFDKDRKEYKAAYPGVSDYAARKACIKALVSEREIFNKNQVVRTSTIEEKAR